MKTTFYLSLMFTSLTLYAQNYPNQFAQIWRDTPLANGGLTPSGAVWSMDGVLDSDGDGQGEFLLSSSWSGAFGNDAMLYEAAGDSFQIVWYQWFGGLDTSAANFSACATGDLDADGLPEIVILNDCYVGQDALYIYEYDPATGGFPVLPTTSWNVNLPGGVLESGDMIIANVDSDSRPELLLAVYSRDPLESHIIIAEITSGSDVADPDWHIEMDDHSTLNYYCYALLLTDLDNDGFAEIIAVEVNYNRLVIWENTGEDQYVLVNDIFMTFEPLAFSADGLAEADFDNNGLNELYIASTAGYFWVITNGGDVSQINFANNVHLLGDYRTYGGFVPTQVVMGNADSPVGQPPDAPDIYICATDSLGQQSIVVDWEYLSGDVTQFDSYQLSIVYSATIGSGLFKPSAMAIGNAIGNTNPEIILGSFSLDASEPHLIAFAAVGPTVIEPPEILPSQVYLWQNYPNPFNSATTIRFTLPFAARVELTVFDNAGRHITTLIDGYETAGEKRVMWNGQTALGMPAASGIYFYRLKTDDGGVPVVLSRKMLLLK